MEQRDSQQRVGISLGEFVETEVDHDRQVLLRAAVSRASAKSGRSFEDARIKSVSEMGEAAGRCHMCSGEIEVRADIVATENGVREKLEHVLDHEGEHAKGNSLEGFTELATTIRLGCAPVPAYCEKVRHAEHVAEVIGRQRALEFARKPEGRILLMREYVKERVHKNVRLEDAVSEGDRHLEMAA